MSLLQAIVLGALQGATEFLPVSSSGHLVLVPWILGWPSGDIVFGAAVHLGTLLAVLVYFREDLWRMVAAWVDTLRRRRIADPYGRLAWLVVVGTVPAALAGYFLEGWFERMFSTPLLVAILLLGTGAILALSERRRPREPKGAHEGSWTDAVLVGLAQAAAIAPGISRSGSTMAAGMLRGIRREEAARFSFLLSLPIIAGAGLLEVVKALSKGQGAGLVLGAVGGVVAAITGFVAIRSLLRYLRTGSLQPFAYYCWAFGGLCLLLAVVRG